MIKGYCYTQERESFYKRQCKEIIVFKYNIGPSVKPITIDTSKFDVIDKISFWLVRHK